VEISFIGHPLDRPQDVRARAFIINWVAPSFKKPGHLLDNDPVYRISYNCNGTCQQQEERPPRQRKRRAGHNHGVDDGNDDEEGFAPGDDQDDGGEATQNASEEAAPRSTRRVVCPGRARLQVSGCDSDEIILMLHHRLRFLQAISIWLMFGYKHHRIIRILMSPGWNPHNIFVKKR